jgi:ketosteroid isomerase-like protein
MDIDDVLVKQSIAEGLYRYCRSLDRMDRALYGTVFEPAADLDYGEHFVGTAEQFCDWVWIAHAGMQAHSHQITNILVDVAEDGGTAVSEAYVTVCLRTNADDAGRSFDVVDRGRYLDHWKRQPTGSWRIASRRYRSDIHHASDASTSPPVTTRRDRSDPSYELFGDVS